MNIPVKSEDERAQQNQELKGKRAELERIFRLSTSGIARRARKFAQ